MTAAYSADEVELLRGLAAIGLTDVSLYHDFRWRKPSTGEVQEVLHPRQSADGWVREKRRCMRVRGDWEEIS